MLHHALFILAAAWVLAHSIMKFPFVWLAVGEASTPFINLRYSHLLYLLHSSVTSHASSPNCDE